MEIHITPQGDIENVHHSLLTRRGSAPAERMPAVPWSRILEGAGIKPLVAVSWGALGTPGEGQAASAVRSSRRFQGSAFPLTVKERFPCVGNLCTSAHRLIFSPIRFLFYECEFMLLPKISLSSSPLKLHNGRKKELRVFKSK